MMENSSVTIRPEIKTSPERRLVGMKMTTNFKENRTAELWRGFMPRRKTIDALNEDLFSVQVFSWPPDPASFDPSLSFDRWAAVEVDANAELPEGMSSLTIPEGTYAVFQHVGATLTAEKAFKYFYSEWLPASGYLLDDRPHFEILGNRYKNNDPESEEEIWIPVLRK